MVRMNNNEKMVDALKEVVQQNWDNRNADGATLCIVRNTLKDILGKDKYTYCGRLYDLSGVDIKASELTNEIGTSGEGISIDEYALESAYWEYDSMHRGNGKFKLNPQSERDAFKFQCRGLIRKHCENPVVTELISTPYTSLEKIVKLLEENLKISLLTPKYLLDINRNLNSINQTCIGPIPK